MTFRFANGAVVTLSPVDARQLRERAWAQRRPNAVTVLDAGDPIDVGSIPLATGDEILDSVLELDRPLSSPLRRLQRELKTGLTRAFVYRGFVTEPDGSARSEFVAVEQNQPLEVGSEVPIDERLATVTAIEEGPRGFDGELTCEWLQPAP